MAVMVVPVILCTFNQGSERSEDSITFPNEGTTPIHPPAIRGAGGVLGGGHNSCMSAAVEILNCKE